VIDPATMPLTRLANSIIDGVASTPAPVATEIEKYLDTDLLFYRAAHPEGLRTRQGRHWDPIVNWAAEALGARFVLVEGVIHVEQPDHAVAAARAAIPAGADAIEAWRLGALNVVTSLTGSALLALALASGRITADEAWTAAHVDEDWNMEFWGRDEIALQRRAYRFAELQAAAKVLEELR
jgi:chaperone required for assembly of F1-ATPase